MFECADASAPTNDQLFFSAQFSFRKVNSGVNRCRNKHGSRIFFLCLFRQVRISSNNKMGVSEVIKKLFRLFKPLPLFVSRTCVRQPNGVVKIKDHFRATVKSFFFEITGSDETCFALNKNNVVLVEP